MSDLKESINTVFPVTEYVHQVRNTLKHIVEKDRKEIAIDLKSIDHANNEELAYENMISVTNKRKDKYYQSMRSWNVNWDIISPIFKFLLGVRKVIYAQLMQ